MENKFKVYWTKASEQIKKFFSHVFWVVLVLGGLGIGFGVGFYYKQIKTVEMPSKMVVVEKQDIILAVDENQRLMLIDKNTGNYPSMIMRLVKLSSPFMLVIFGVNTIQTKHHL